jgi:hypothetical protein
MATARIFLLLLCTAPAFGHWLPHRHLLKRDAGTSVVARFSGYKTSAMSRPPGVEISTSVGLAGMEALAAARIVGIAEKQLGVREQGGHNAGTQVEAYLRYVGLGKGHPWCAAFVSWVHAQAGFAQPRSGWSPSLFPTARRIPTAKPAALLGIYVGSLKRIAHVGLVTGVRQDWVESIEGNTNPAGSREGDGVYRRLRHRRAVSLYAYYL